MSDYSTFAAMTTADTSVKEQIIETACRLFYNHGYHLTGINQIIEEAGVAKASLYYHFPSKEDLCIEYLKRRSEVWSKQLYRSLEGITDPGKRLIKTFECRSQYLSETKFGGCSYFRIIAEMPQRSEKINAQVILQKEKQRGYFIEQVKELTGLKPESALELGNTMYLLFDGATAQCQVYRATWPMDSAIAALKTLLYRNKE